MATPTNNSNNAVAGVFVALAACVLYGFSTPVSDVLQWLEQVANPVYVLPDTSMQAIQIVRIGTIETLRPV